MHIVNYAGVKISTSKEFNNIKIVTFKRIKISSIIYVYIELMLVLKYPQQEMEITCGCIKELPSNFQEKQYTNIPWGK